METDIQTKILEQMLESGSSYAELMNAVFESGKENHEANWEEMVRQIADNYLQFYREFAGKYLKAPQLGIYRESLHQVLDAADAQHQLAIETGDFLVKFFKPLKKTLKTLDRKLKSKHASENSFESKEEIYNFISGLLEKEYDDYLKSPEGVQDVADVIQSYVAYREKSDDAKDILLKALSIPTSKEMEDIYKSTYDLKKRVRKQDKQIAEQNRLIDSLSAKIMSMEARFDRHSGKE